MLRAVPTPAERLATLEAIAEANRASIDAIYASINSGPGFEWEQCVRGRLHAMANQLAPLTIDQRRRQSAIRTWQWSVIAGCAVVTAASPYVLFFASR